MVEGENLDVLVGGQPFALPEGIDEEDLDDLQKLAKKEPVKAMLLSLLAEKYGMEEEDFLRL